MTRKKQKIFGGKYKKENCELLVPYYCKGNVFTNKEFGDTIFLNILLCRISQNSPIVTKNRFKII